MTIVCSATIKLTTTENKLADPHLAARNSSKFVKCTGIITGLRHNPLKYLGSQTMPVLSQFQISFHVFVDFATRVWNCVCYLFKRNIKAYEPIKYKIHPLSPVSRHRLGLVSKKILVLDLDETLVHSCHATLSRNTVKPGTPYDFRVNVIVDKQPVTFYVYKRPHVDFFLKIVSKWYDVVLFTASLEVYGDAVADKLDRGKNIIRRRYYRQHCTPDYGSYTKDISAVCNDLNRICIVDNSPAAYRCFPNNAIPIQSYLTDPMDTALLKLLPLLDALRFTKDVRSVLSRNLHLNRTW